MNYLTSFLHWSNEPTDDQSNQNNPIPPRDTQYRRAQYISPLSTLPKVECADDNDSQPSSLASALFSGWGSSSVPTPHSSPSNVSHSQYNAYPPQKPYDLPFITSQHSLMIPTSPGMQAAVSITASPPPPMNLPTSTSYQTIRKKHSNSATNQIKFTPKYKKRQSQSNDVRNRNNIGNSPLMLPSHPAPQTIPLDDDLLALDTIAESRTPSPMKAHVTHNMKTSTLMDALRLDLEDVEDSDYEAIQTPPPRAPLVPFASLSPTALQVMVQSQSVTESVHSSQEMAEAGNDSNLMVSLLTGCGTNYDDEGVSSRNTTSNHLLPLHQSVPLAHLGDSNEEDDETNEVNLHYNNHNNNDDTNSVISDFEDATVWFDTASTKKQQNKIRVTCNNCYLWRHHVNKLEIDLTSLRRRTEELEENINVAEDNMRLSQQHYGELKQENERLRDKNRDLKREIAQETQEATDALILCRKQKESETQSIHKQYQHLMKQKNELEASYNEQVKRCNEKEAQESAWNAKYERIQREYGDECTKYKLKIAELDEECKRLKTTAAAGMHDDNDDDDDDAMTSALREYETLQAKYEENNGKLSEVRQRMNVLRKMAQQTEEELASREEQLAQSNEENDRMMDQNYELNEKLNCHISQMDAYRQRLCAVKSAEDEYNEKVQILSGKLDAAVTRRDAQLKKNVRLKNQVKSLRHENAGLRDSIHHLESVIDDTYGLAEDKERKLSHLKRKNNENELHLDNLKKRMKKHERQQTSYRQIEVDQISKSHRKMDKKMSNLRKSNTKLQNEKDELNDAIKELKRHITDAQSELTETRRKFKSSVSTCEANISQMTAHNNKIMSQQMNLSAQLDTTEEENTKLRQQMDGLQAKYDEMESMKHIEIRFRAHKLKMIEMDIHNDTIYQLMRRCRNIFVNTNRLSPKLMMQLIESCHRSCVMFYQMRHKFARFLTKCQVIHQQFNNVQQSIRAKYSIVDTITRHPNKAARATRSRASSSFSDLNRAKKSDGKSKKKQYSNSKIRRPIEQKEAPHIEAYNQIYLLLLQNITNAKNDMEELTQMYDESIDYTSYNNNNEEEEFDWDQLSSSIHSSTQRYEEQQNNERFAAMIQRIQTSTKELRTLHAKSNAQLNASYYVELDDEDGFN
eukprot:996400_1